MLFLFPAFCWAQQSQTIVFTQPPTAQAFAGTSVVLAATASSGLPVTFSVASGPAQVSNGSTLTFTGVGTVVVQADQAGGSGYSAAPSVQAPSTNAVLLTEPVTTASPAVSTVVTFTAAGTLAQVSALTQGAVNLDFSLPAAAAPGLSPCVVGVAYTVGQTCSLQFVFTPTRPGIRYGGITLSDGAGNLLANSYIYGEGVGPQVLYEPIVQTPVGNSLGTPSGVAINGNGDLFVSNQNFGGTASALVEIAAKTGTVTPIGNFSGSGKDVAVDGSGNVFLLTYDTLFEVVAVNGSIPLPPATPVIRTLATGFTVNGGGLGLDGSGNAYIANSPGGPATPPPGVVYEVYTVSGVIPDASAKTVIGPPFVSPTGVAVDSSGNVYISDENNGIIEMFAVNGRIPASPVVVNIGSGYVSPSNIRLDNYNDIFISDAGLPGILEFQAMNGVVAQSAPPKSIGSGFSNPEGLLVDDSGDVFVADGSFPDVIKLNFSSVPTLTFAPTLVGQTSADSPQAVTYTNAGNADLVFAPPPAGSNPAITPPSFTLGASSTCPQLVPGSAAATLAVGASCTNQVSFTPLVKGPITGTLTTVDNNLSVPNAMQVVPLNGIGTLEKPNIQFTVSNHFVDDPPFTVMATSDSPGAITYSVMSGPASVVGNTVTLAGVPGTVSLVATQAENDPYDTGSATATFNVVKHSQTINFLQPPTPVLLSASPLTLSATASSGLPVTFSVLSGPGTVSGNVLTLTGYGPIVIAADQAGNTIYDPAPRATRQIVVLDDRVFVRLTGTPNPVFLKNPVVFTASVLSLEVLAPSGSIAFMEGPTLLGTVPVNGCCASFSTSTLTLGQHNVTAIYSGDAVFAPKTSDVLSVLVEDFAVTISNPDVTIGHGGTAIYNLTVSTVGGPLTAAPIVFSVAGNPDHSPVVFSPALIATGSGTTTLTMTIQTPDYPVGPFARLSRRGGTLAFLAFGVFFGLARRRRLFASRSGFLATLLLAVGMSVAVTSIAGCSDGWGAQPYSMTVTATSGALSHSAAAHLVSQ